MRRWLRFHGLSVAMFGMFLLTLLGGQLIAGRIEYNSDRARRGQPGLGIVEYLGSAHFGEATAENWESEFFQMGVYVLATAFLFQVGSAESCDPRRKPAARKKAVPPNAPWPVRRGGWVRRVYEHSLSLGFLLLFTIAFLWHGSAGLKLFNEERLADGEAPLGLSGYLTSARFWFESFQNWQSEFLAIGSMVVLSIWLREKDSPESKSVETPIWENED